MITSNIPAFNNIFSRNELTTKFNTIINKLSSQFNEEDIQGFSGQYSNIQQLFLAYMFAIYVNKRLYFGETLPEIEGDFDMSEIRSHLLSSGINLYRVYDIFDIPY